MRIPSGFIALKLKKYNIIPESIAISGLIIGLMSAYLYSRGTYLSIAFASILYFLAWFLDFVDGDLARITNKVSERGEWLDSVSGKMIEMSIYSGILLGLIKTHQSRNNIIWIIGLSVVALHHIIVSIIGKESTLKLKFHRNNETITEANIYEGRKKRSIIRSILREFTVGIDLNGWFIVLGGLINMLMLTLILCLINNVCYLLLRLFQKTKYYFFTAVSN